MLGFAIMAREYERFRVDTGTETRKGGGRMAATEVVYGQIPYFMSTADLARLTGETPASIRRGIKEGRIVADMVNGRWRICRDTIFPRTKEAVHDGE